MKRWLPTILAFAFVCGMIFLADAGYGVAFFCTVQDSGADKLGHFGLIGGLAYFLNVSLLCRLWRRVLLGSLIVIVLCTAEELSQAWLPRRRCDIFDLAADFAGIWVAGLLARRVCARGAQVGSGLQG